MSSTSSSTSSRSSSAPAPRLLVPILVVGLLGGVFVLLAWPAPGTGGGSHPPSSAPSAARSAAGPATGASAVRRVEAEAAQMLGAWDRRRAEAWSAGDPGALEALYVPGASAGEADVAMLRDWAARGLAVHGLTTQLLDVRVLAHDPHRWRLLVRDRVTGAVASGEGFAERMPAGATVEREVVLRRLPDGWRVASVRSSRHGAERR